MLKKGIVLASLLDIIFPPVCPLCEEGLMDGILCADCRGGMLSKKIKGPFCAVCGIPFIGYGDVPETHKGRLCGRCITEKTPFKEARSAFAYEGAVLEAIHRFKYGGRVALAGYLGRLASEAAEFKATPDVVVPVPLHRNRLRKRGFNQSLLIAREVAKKLRAPVDYINLKRVRATDPQINLRIKEREDNIKGAFVVKDDMAFRDKNVLLIDDVFTTGATIRECAKALNKAGAEVYVLTLARTLIA
jgi:ComF family protein